MWVRVLPLASRVAFGLNGDDMTRKGKNEIPDFSKKRKDSKPQGVPDATKLPLPHPPTPPPVRAGKPPATSMKSGRRGS